MQLNLTDYEAQLLEQRLRGRTVSFSDADHLVIQYIADRLLRREVAVAHMPGQGWIYTSGDPDPIKTPEGRRFAPISVEQARDMLPPDFKHLVSNPSVTVDQKHNTRREADEYACSCGARWDVSDGDEHPR